ncbi:DMT family transporter [Spongiactinospora sp. TRM90649]|uniref:EamA family transporter n=1 Tax=Spongiactinospora sp. TRM90649 TaxID=3031114 RepID=UPI0023F9A0A3|nr:DMT family transporter [Spongiactinospora sp. TRM90649]MDF5755472.1 DMT family transporter [Spongiactinospora sp. TRM90649]
MKKAGLAIAVLASWCFGFSGAMAKFLGEAGLSSNEAVWVRMAGAGVLMLVVLALVRPRALRIPRRRLPLIVAYAVVAVAGVQVLFFQAITRLPVGVALLFEFTAPVLVVLWVRFVRRVRVPRSAYIGAVVAFAGLCVVVEVWQGMVLDGLGLLFAAGAAACCAGYFLLSDSFGDDVDPLGLIAWGLAGAAVVLAPLARPWNMDWSAFERSATLGGNTLPALLAAAWLIVVATVIAYIAGVTAVRRLSAAVGSTVSSLEVIAGAVIAWILIGEALGPYQIIGGVIVIAGALLAQQATAGLPTHEPPVPARKDPSPTPV